MKRAAFIDYAKALSVFFVVFIHVGFSALDYIALFIMPVFFAATGYTFTPGKRTFKNACLTRFKICLLPFFSAMLLYTAAEVVRAYLFGYGTFEIALPSLVNTVYGSGVLPFEGGFFACLKDIMSYKAQPSHGVDLILPLNCHLWFLPAAFVAYTLFFPLAGATAKNLFYKVAAISALLLVAAAEVVFPDLYQLPFGIGRGALGSAFMLWGFWIKKHKLMENKPFAFHLLTGLGAFALFTGSILAGSDGSAFIRSYYGPYNALSVLITFLGGSAGVWLLFGLCRFLQNANIGKRLNRLLSFAGQNVITIYLWHMAVKLPLDVVYVVAVKGNAPALLDEYKMGLMPEHSALYMIFEGVAILAACLMLAAFKKRKQRI